MAWHSARSLSLAAGVVAVIVIFGFLIQVLPTSAPPGNGEVPRDATATRDIDDLFSRATIAMEERRYPEAITHLSRLLEIDPTVPEAHVNLAFSHMAMANWETANRHLETARTLRPSQANAYFGLALIHEQRGEIDEAILAMQTFLHLAEDDNEFRRRAKAAIWEWQSGKNQMNDSQEAPEKSSQDGESSASK